MQLRSVFFCSLLCSAGVGQAETITLSHVLDRVDQALEVRSADYGAAAARAQARQAARWENPALEVEAEGVGGSAASGTDTMETSVLLKQPVDFSGRRAAISRFARQQVAASEAERAMARRAAAREGRQLFYAALAAQQRMVVADEQLGRAQKLADIARVRVEAGAASPLDAERAKVELADAKMTAATAVGLVRTGLRNLALFLDMKPLPSLEGDLFAPASLPVKAAPDLFNHPKVVAAEARRSATAEQYTAVRRSAWGSVELSAGWKQAEETDSGSWILGLGVALPVWHRNPGEIGQAHAELKQAENLRDRTLLTVELETVDAWRSAETAAEQADYLQKESLPSAQLMVEGLQEGYRAGKFSLMEALLAQASWAATANRRIDAYEQLRMAEADVIFWTINP